MSFAIRAVETADLAPLARLWHAGWCEAHAAIVPSDLIRLRSLGSFQRRLRGFGSAARTAGPVGAPIGLCVIDGAEIDQLFVAPAARGTGLAAALLEDGHLRISEAGYTEAFLFCAPENARAAAFYTRMGWKNAGLRVEALDTEEGPFEMPVIVFTKAV